MSFFLGVGDLPSPYLSSSYSQLKKLSSSFKGKIMRKNRKLLGSSDAPRNSTLKTNASVWSLTGKSSAISSSSEGFESGYGEMVDSRGEEDILSLDMTLGTSGKTRLVFTDHGWQVDDKIHREYKQKLQKLTDQLSEVRWEQRVTRPEGCEEDYRSKLDGEAEAASKASAEEIATLQFKNQILIEMLAIAQLDESHATQSYDRERLKADEYRRELKQCYAHMLRHRLDPPMLAKDITRGNGEKSHERMNEERACF